MPHYGNNCLVKNDLQVNGSFCRFGMWFLWWGHLYIYGHDSLTLKGAITTAVENTFFFFFKNHFSQKISLDRQFTWNIKTYFLWKIKKKKTECLLLEIWLGTLRVDLHHIDPNRQSQLMSSALSSACDFKSHFCKQCEPRSDCSVWSGSILFAGMQK